MDQQAILTNNEPDAKSAVHERSADKAEIQGILCGYLQEARNARQSGMNPRDDKWREVLDLYWNRYDFSTKAEWQAQEVTPEVPAFVDRFAAALKEAYGVAAEGMFTVQDPADADQSLAMPIKRMTDVWLSACGANASGQPMGFEGVFEEQMKLGALMASSALVAWKPDTAHGRVAVESVDPRELWLDHTSRGMYRIRKIEMDRHRVLGLSKLKDGGGRALFNLDELHGQATDMINDTRTEREELTGHGQEILSNRGEITLHEFYGDIVRPDGTVIAENALTVLAGEKWVIRGPEKNPFWHGRDWIVYAPLVTVPLSPYGRGYAEDFGSVARTFNKVTNLILDAVAFSSVRAFATIPEMLQDAQQMEGGITSGKNFKLQFGMGKAEDFITAIDLGTLSSDTVQVWQMLKSALTEAARINEIGLGQFAPNSRTSATEVSETQQSSGALVRSVAQTIERRWFEPLVNLVWKTGLQHVSKNDMALREAAGPEMFDALLARRKELASHPITFQARGLSTLIHKSQKLRALIQILQLVAGNELLLQQFLQVVDLAKLVDLLFDLSNLDMRRLQLSERDKLVQSFGQGLGGGEQGGSPPRPAGDMAGMLGIAR